MRNSSSVWVVIPCAGAGSRMGSCQAKQYLPFNASTLIAVTLERFIYRPDVKGIIIPVTDKISFLDAIESLGDISKPIHLVAGGVQRQDSVHQALLFLKDKAQPMDLVAVHDAARPCVRQSLLDDLFKKAAANASGALLAEPCSQTVKQVDQGTVSKTLDRATIYLAQTPQVFMYQKLLETYKATSSQIYTDESSRMEAAGLKPLIVEGNSENIKITYPQDIYLAEAMMSKIIEDDD